MSADWLLGVLVPSACISLWCMLWCCFAQLHQLPNTPRQPVSVTRQTFKYNPVLLRSPPPSPPVHHDADTVAYVVDNNVETTHSTLPTTRTLPGLHFINSLNIQN